MFNTPPFVSPSGAGSQSSSSLSPPFRVTLEDLCDFTSMSLRSYVVYTANSFLCDFFLTEMAKVLGFLVLALSALICEAAIFKPISESHRSAALELFNPAHGSLSRFD